MSTERFKEGQIIPYQGRFEDGAGNGITDAAGVIAIRRTSNNNYWNGATWQVAFVTNVMSEISDANVPGFWKYDFDSSVGDAVDNYVAEMIDTSGNSSNKLGLSFSYVGNYIDSIETTVDDTNTKVTAQDAQLLKILGLQHENFVLEPTAFENNEMTAGDVRIYDSKATAELDDKVSGLIAKYSVTAPRTGGELDKFTQTLEP